MRGILFGTATLALALPLSAAAQSQATQPNQPKQNQQQQDQQQKNQQTATTVALGDIEENPTRYLGQMVTVTAEVQEVLGPRLFTIDERQWIDFDGEVLVMVPAPLAAMVRDDDPVTVTGTVRPLVRADIEREWGWFDEPGVDIDFNNRAIIIADRVTSNGEEMALRMTVDREGPVGTNREGAVGTTGSTGSSGSGPAMQPITDAQMLAAANDDRLIGRRVEIANARVASMASGNGFWISGTGNERFFVLPGDKMQAQIAQGQNVSISGVVLELPSGMKERIGDRTRDEDIYVYASQIEQAKAQQK